MIFNNYRIRVCTTKKPFGWCDDGQTVNRCYRFSCLSSFSKEYKENLRAESPTTLWLRHPACFAMGISQSERSRLCRHAGNKTVFILWFFYFLIHFKFSWSSICWLLEELQLLLLWCLRGTAAPVTEVVLVVLVVVTLVLPTVAVHTVIVAVVRWWQ